MPPSPQEIKVRLDSAVDEEGNVLNMAVVLEVVSILEKIPISKEALETTRIGRVINLMRKKTSNEDLAKRAKKLVKKWQKLVSNHFKNLKSTDSPLSAGETGRLTPTINGVIRTSCSEPTTEGAQKTNIDAQRKTSLKRKRTENFQHPLASENHSSDAGGILLDNNDEPHTPLQHKNESLRVQPRVNFTKSPNAPNNGESIGHCLPEGVSERSLEKTQPERTSNEVLESTVNYQNLSAPADAGQSDHETSFPVSDRTELRPQETTCGPLPNDYLAIEPEDFTVRRALLPERHIDPYCEADGVNGCFHNERFYHWIELIPRNEGQLTILPYVNLE